MYMNTDIYCSCGIIVYELDFIIMYLNDNI